MVARKPPAASLPLHCFSAFPFSHLSPSPLLSSLSLAPSLSRSGWFIGFIGAPARVSYSFSLIIPLRAIVRVN